MYNKIVSYPNTECLLFECRVYQDKVNELGNKHGTEEVSGFGKTWTVINKKASEELDEWHCNRPRNCILRILENL